MSETSYKPGNLSDKFKHADIEALMKTAALQSLRYIELHSAEGLYEIDKKQTYAGTALRALAIATKRKIPVTGYLHEIRDDARIKLMKNVAAYPVEVRADWRDHIHEYIKPANKETLFVIDPESSLDYNRPDNHIGMPLMEWIRLILRQESGIFCYMNEFADSEGRREIECLSTIIAESGIPGVDLHHRVNDCRGDHIIVAAHQPVLDALINKHFFTAHELKVDAWASIILPRTKKR